MHPLERRLCELRDRLRRLRVEAKGSGAGFDLEREIVLRDEELAALERTMHERFLGPATEQTCPPSGETESVDEELEAGLEELRRRIDALAKPGRGDDSG